MPEDDAIPSVSVGLFRVGTFLAVVTFVTYTMCDLYSESAALQRLTATAERFPYTESCDAEGNFITEGRQNCVDLNHYVFVYGAVSRALRKACTGKTAEVLSFERGKVARTEINTVEKLLRFRAKYGVNSPC